MSRNKNKSVEGMRLQTGAVSTEWTATTLIMIVVLFVPLPGTSQSVMGLMMDSLQGFHQNASFIFSLP